MTRTLEIFAALSILILGGCADSNLDLDDVRQTDPKASESLDYPHPENWKEASVHGPVALGDTGSYQEDRCNLCHSIEGEDREGTVPPCRSCHQIYPHAELWGNSDIHVESLRTFETGLGNGIQKECATSCHGNDLKGGLSDISCTKCHSGYPHPASWKEAAMHGPAFLSSIERSSEKKCGDCHALKSSTSDRGVPGCQSCHASYPHKEGWGESNIHVKVLRESGGDLGDAIAASCAGSCHGEDLQGGLSGVSCTQCHSGYPHPEGWNSPIMHGPASVDPGQGYVEDRCGNCHAVEPASAEVGVPACKSCHEKFPHDEGWGNSDIHVRPYQGLGVGVRTAIEKDCATSCHGADLKGGISNVECTKCHSGWPHTTDWLQAVQHGLSIFQNPSGELSACSNCHGSDLQGGTYALSCTTCHDLPNPAASVQHPPSQAKACESCHATNLGEVGEEHLLLALPPELCQDCHASEVASKTYSHSPVDQGDACMNCHEPHDASNDHLLRNTEKSLCFSCHDQVIQSTAYGSTRNIKAAFDQSTNRHFPFGNDSCSTCHSTHGSENDHLLQNNEPPFWVAGNFSESICFDCHSFETYVTDAVFPKPSSLQRPSAELPTQFVRVLTTAAESLHGKHVLQYGVSCLGCHDPHANNDLYLLRDYITYQDPGSNSFWKRSDCRGCHVGELPEGYPSDLW